MIGNRPSKEMYRDRVYLLALHFITESKEIIGGIRLYDTVDTAASMSEKLLENMPSYRRSNRCQNSICFNPERNSDGVVITIYGVDGNIQLQQEMDKFFQPLTELCLATNCNYLRDEVTELTNHIIIELLSIPKGFRASGNYSHLENITKISQNYAGKVMLKLGDITKQISINGNIYNLRGVIAFYGSARELRQSYGHYVAYGLRSNDQWEIYDDLKEQVMPKSKNVKVNVELLFYTT
ncbi:uncharacterized protein LOC132925491 [Rhopalosiphum padi]|uniref:uncharacterized protein LOC132925491 n=1 Tax=Rhopalosiphum padi TaxID=40932 RepID=UPI00298DD487|nr:uncharacterized protein LOC132925491 [Rhopalosiphum padi]